MKGLHASIGLGRRRSSTLLRVLFASSSWLFAIDTSDTLSDDETKQKITEQKKSVDEATVTVVLRGEGTLYSGSNIACEHWGIHSCGVHRGVLSTTVCPPPPP